MPQHGVNSMTTLFSPEAKTESKVELEKTKTGYRLKMLILVLK